jgi:hypothetical protein
MVIGHSVSRRSSRRKAYLYNGHLRFFSFSHQHFPQRAKRGNLVGLVLDAQSQTSWMRVIGSRWFASIAFWLIAEVARFASICLHKVLAGGVQAIHGDWLEALGRAVFFDP